MRKTTVTATKLCNLTVALENRHFHWLSIGAKRDVLMFSVEQPVRECGSSLVRKNAFHQFTLHHWHNNTLKRVDLPPTQQVLFEAQILEKENYLCVAGRCAPDEANAHVFDAQGSLRRSFHVGDGVEDVQVSIDNQVWVSYFDQGIFSGMKLSDRGLNCFNARGQQIFGFLSDMAGKANQIYDCYALNVASNQDTYLCYYAGFPLTQLRDREIKSVHQPTPEMIGSHAFAVDRGSLLFVGGYHNEKQILWRSEPRNLQVEVEVLDESGEALIWDRVCGRGADLFLCNGPQVWLLSLQEVGF